MRSAYCTLRISAALTLLPAAGLAQTQLPALTVEGATLEAPPHPRSGTEAATGASAARSEATPKAADQQSADGSNGVPLDAIGSAVTIVTGEQLRAQQIRHAADALRSLPGVSVSRGGGPGNLTSVRIRGAEANHTLVLIDGIEANATSDGDFDYATLLTEDIDRIEVIRGPQSGLYGSKALGGVVNILTRTGKGPLTATVRTEGGAYGTSDIAARVSGGSDKAWIAASAQRRGVLFFNNAPVGAEEDPWSAVSAAIRGGATLLPGVTVDFSLRNVNRRLEFDLDQVPPGGTLTRQTDGPNSSRQDTFLGGVNLRWNALDGALTQVFSANRNMTSVESLTSGAFGGFSDNHSEIDKLAYLATYRFETPALAGAKHSVSGLVESQAERFTPGPAGPGPFDPDGVERERGRMAYVGEYRGDYFNRLSLTGTVRHDDNDTFQDFDTWRAAASLRLPEIGLRPHASIGTGVALPGMFEQFGSILGVFVPNPNLKPEESKGWDAGVELTLVKNRALLDVTTFHANLRNEIIGFGNTIENLDGESQRRGVELDLRTKLVPWLMVGASYTYLHATQPDGRQEIRRPRHAGRADVTYLFGDGKGTFNVAAIYNGRMTDDNFGTFPATTVTLDDYWLVSAALTYKLQPGVELFGRVENLLDTKYEEISGYNAPGLAAYAGVKLTFGGPDGMAWAK
ncbi:MAG TPA: TonB-dependent receptor [Hyphomicrobiaceae bacterium]|nr:TonB-dependent receptor [Hyphomicrobiaceae bacterium]